MLPQVRLSNISRDDVDRIGHWLADREISARWFGHYGCGEPLHLGYNPEHMIEADKEEWARVFGDPSRRILSIHDDGRQHIGECTFSLDGDGGAEISVLIGRKEIWHRGYGTATVIELLDNVLNRADLQWVWVSVPEDNPAAQGLFRKLGFVPGGAAELCKGRDDSVHKAVRLTLDYRAYRERHASDGGFRTAAPAVAVAGLTGSGSERVAEKIAAMLGGRVADQEISDMVCQRLGCSQGELETVKQAVTSRWSRLLRAIAVPAAWPTSYEAGLQWPGSEALYEEPIGAQMSAPTKYKEALGGVVKQLSRNGGVVLHGHGSHLFLPSDTPSLTVFVSLSEDRRRNAVVAAHGVDSEEAGEFIKRSDADTKALFKNMLGSELLDPGAYDMTLNLDRLSVEAAAEIVIGSLRRTAPAFGDSSRALVQV